MTELRKNYLRTYEPTLPWDGYGTQLMVHTYATVILGWGTANVVVLEHSPAEAGMAMLSCGPGSWHV